jgi:hypothetical protein
MKSVVRIALWTTIAAALIAGGALAADDDGSIKDEKSTGSGAGSGEGTCDIRSLDVEKTAKVLEVTVGLRAGQTRFVNTLLHINTKGAAKSDPELKVSSDGSITEKLGIKDGIPQEQNRGDAKVTVKGKDVIFKIPLGALGASKTIGVQAETCGEGATDIAPGRDYFGDTTFQGEIDHQYLTVDGTDRVIQGRVVLSCSGENSCFEEPLMNVKITANGPKDYRAKTGADGVFSFIVKKGVYKVTADANGVRIKDKARSLDLRKPGTKKANFDGCGFESGGASTAAVPGGIWAGKDCSSEVELRWRNSDTAGQGLSVVKWNSLPTCETGDGNGRDVTNWTPLLAKETDFKPGSWQITAERVDFKSTLKWRLPPQGYLSSDGTGRFSATKEEGNCTHRASVTLKHRK